MVTEFQSERNEKDASEIKFDGLFVSELDFSAVYKTLTGTASPHLPELSLVAATSADGKGEQLRPAEKAGAEASLQDVWDSFRREMFTYRKDSSWKNLDKLEDRFLDLLRKSPADAAHELDVWKKEGVALFPGAMRKYLRDDFHGSYARSIDPSAQEEVWKQLLYMSPYMRKGEFQKIELKYGLLNEHTYSLNPAFLNNLENDPYLVSKLPAELKSGFIEILTRALTDINSELSPKEALKVLRVLSQPDLITSMSAAQTERLAAFARVPGFYKGENSYEKFNPGQKNEARELLRDIFRQCRFRENKLKGNETDLLLLESDLLRAQRKSIQSRIQEIAKEAEFGILDSPDLDQAALLKRAFGLEIGKELERKISLNYTKEQLQTIAGNLELVSSLAPKLRAQLMGWTELDADARKAKGWVENPPVDPDVWNQMSELEKENERWRDAVLERGKLLGQLSEEGGLVSQYNAAILAPDLVQRLRDVFRQCYEIPSAKLLANTEEKIQTVAANLAKTTEEGSFRRWIFESDHQNQVIVSKQAELSGELSELRRNRQYKVLEQKKEVELSRVAVDLAIFRAQYKQYSIEGDQGRMALLAGELLVKYGGSLKALAPDLWQQFSLPSSVLRKDTAGYSTQGKDWPDYKIGPSPNDALEGFRAALGLAGGNKPAFGLLQVDDSRDDARIMHSLMLKRLEADPALASVMEPVSLAAARLDDFQKLLKVKDNSDCYMGYITAVMNAASDIRLNLKQVSPEQIEQLKKRSEAITEALDTYQRREIAEIVGIKDPVIRQMAYQRLYSSPIYRGLQDRKNMYSNLVSLLTDQELRKSLDEILDKGYLSESGLTSWLGKHGPHIIEVVATVGAAILTSGSSLLCQALVSSTVRLIAQEATSETLFRINKDYYSGFGIAGDKGSKLGELIRKFPETTADKSEYDALEKMLDDVASHYAKTIFRESVMFLMGAGLERGATGLASFASANLASMRKIPVETLGRWVGSSRRAEQMALETGVRSLTVRRALARLAKDSAKDIVKDYGQIALEGRIKAQFSTEELKTMGNDIELMTNLCVTCGTAMMAGARSGMKKPILGHFQVDSRKLQVQLAPGQSPEIFLSFMREHGYVVSGGKGRWSVLPVGAEPGTKPVLIEDCTGAYPRAR